MTHGGKVREVIRWKCLTCKFSIRAIISRVKTVNRVKRHLILELSKQGHTLTTIRRLAHCDSRTVRSVLVDYQPRACGCGKPINHAGSCPTRWNNWRQQAAASIHSGSVNQEIWERISNSLPISLSVDARQEISQNMLLDIIRRADEVIDSVGQYVKQYWKEGSSRYDISLDAPDSIASRLVG